MTSRRPSSDVPPPPGRCQVERVPLQLAIDARAEELVQIVPFRREVDPLEHRVHQGAERGPGRQAGQSPVQAVVTGERRPPTRGLAGHALAIVGPVIDAGLLVGGPAVAQ